jgi:hypothetical protein
VGEWKNFFRGSDVVYFHQAPNEGWLKHKETQRQRVEESHYMFEKIEKFE